MRLMAGSQDGGIQMIEDYRKLLEAIMSEGLDIINSLSDDELRKVIDCE